ncbi:hypervirulence associated TUDOR domain-containing protein [Falsirhodobacter xinxiangensis]|uniref:DUF2945 domain-containing protein n=1 Tax=Falsirhodobacter xinxiangensis TaxID=2530049 RepID=UPI0010AA6927|nr:DUF2945 domain-containing protein [Rhodobacter xinxiangensis]
MGKFSKGDKVHWKWGSSTAKGSVEEVFARKVSRTIKGRKITRKGSREKPAYLLKQEDGGKVLKLESELSKG